MRAGGSHRHTHQQRRNGRCVESDDAVTNGFTLVWFAVRACCWVVGVLVRFVHRAPWTALVVTAAAALVVVWGTAMLVNVVVAVVMVLLNWRMHFAGSYRATVGTWWARWVRRWLLYAWVWPFIAARHGLAATHVDPIYGGSYTDRKQLVKLRNVHVGPGVDRLLLALPIGTDTDTVATACDGLAHSLRATAVRVRVAKPGRVWVDVIRRDTLAPVLRPVPILTVTTTAAAVRLLDGVPIGRCEDGSSWRLAIRGTHVLIAGATGSGKGSVQWSLVRGLSDAVAAGLVELVVFDPKGGQEFAGGQDLFAQFHDGDVESMADALENLADAMATRQRDLAAGLLPSLDGGRLHLPALGSPHTVIVIDELATLTALADSKTSKRIEHALGLLLTKARAGGMTVVAAVQDPAKDVVRWRNLFPTRIALRLDEPLQADMVLGTGQRLRGAVADAIPQHTPGVGYVRIDGQPDPTRVRASYVTAQDITDLLTTPRLPAAPLALAPALAPAPADDDETPEEAPPAVEATGDAPPATEGRQAA